MATLTTAPRSNEVKLDYGVPQVVAFKFLQAKVFDGSFGQRALFTLADDRRMWLDAEDGSEIERSLREIGVQRGELVRLTKVKYPRGGGHAIRVERVADSYAAPAPADDIAGQLERSVAIARTEGPQAFRRNAHVLPDAAPLASPVQSAAAGVTSGDQFTAARLTTAYLAAIDAVAEAQAYADKRGLKVTFGSDDVRATAISAFIQAEKAAMGARY
jgi:hypothetical protein